MRRILSGGALAVAGALGCARPEPVPPATTPAAAPGAASALFPVATPRIAPEAAARVAAAMSGVLDRAVADSAFPGAYAAVGTKDGVVAELGVGRIDWAPDAPRPDANTLWDLASLTKVVGTTSAMLQLVAEGKVDPEAPVKRYLPEWTGGDRFGQQTLVKHLMSHS